MSLIRFVKEGDFGAIKKNFRLVAGYAAENVNTVDEEGKSALIWATLVKTDSTMNILKFLLSHGANPNLQDSDGKTALMHICEEDEYETIFDSSEILEIVKILLDHGADPNLQDKDGWTAPMFVNFWATWDNENELMEIMRVFLQKGYDANKQNNVGNTWLHYTCTISPLEVSELLIPYTNLQLKNMYGETVLIKYLNAITDHENNDKNGVFYKLLAHGADVNATDASGKTVLMYAVESTRESGNNSPNYTELFNDIMYCEERIKMLLRLGANVNSVWQGKTAKDLAPLTIIKNLLTNTQNENEDPIHVRNGGGQKLRKNTVTRYQKRKTYRKN